MFTLTVVYVSLDEGRASRPVAIASLAFYVFVTRRNAAISPATREFMRLARKVLQDISGK
ncbi:hypothetical protein KPL76_01590 [Subtercola sp. PAMC28395]|uniref:hypothetical protein n=1 Tax=Subtercola sp. PAMC28395 TaxID=2846775 RepID=UPI001C0C057D|nr:hypothetical protein [Subtercola sp. PAMC28395]QWT24154.1 hypothetical protein KPL76_01590 [Subtercola sp. PAMC28395]